MKSKTRAIQLVVIIILLLIILLGFQAGKNWQQNVNDSSLNENEISFEMPMDDLNEWNFLKLQDDLCSAKYVDDLKNLGNNFINYDNVMVQSFTDSSLQSNYETITMFYINFGYEILQLANLIADDKLKEAQEQLNYLLQLEAEGKILLKDFDQDVQAFNN